MLERFYIKQLLRFCWYSGNKKRFFSSILFQLLCGLFDWNFLPASGTAGGVLVGLRTSKFNIISWDIKQFCVSALASNIGGGFTWKLITVYGSAYDEHKQEFLNELLAVMSEWEGPTLIGGDFNLIRNSAKKNNGNINYHWADSFNEWIEHWGLIEIKNPNRAFTRTNNQEQLIMAVLDRILVSTDFEAFYPMANVTGISRLGSDHVPLVINFGTS